MTNHRFKVSSTYENEKGSFKVLEIQGEWMLAEWDDGGQLKTKVGLQEKIQERLEREALQPKTGGTRKTPDWMGRSFNGLQAADFQDGVTGTHWRSREQLGGAVAKLIDAREPMNSWSIYRRPEIHWAAISRYRAEKAWLVAKFFIRLDEESGTFGYYIERSNEKADSRVDWLNFLNWLANDDHVTWLHQTMQSQGMRIADPYGGANQAFRRTIEPNGKNWCVTFSKGRTEEIAITDLADYLRKVPDKHWLNLVIGHRLAAEDLVSQGTGVASTIAACFTTLAPVYENRNP
ncbi:hypothetical protein [Prosthecobacter sp.]|uniref:hypothetical protein n=1 Tax=Prosthecobacter sp. TaxID=1965333 RepID=UPI0025F3A3E2|nr:hypothetical protein [Prosthecobacter sp.]